jgi:hypothetical protein
MKPFFVKEKLACIFCAVCKKRQPANVEPDVAVVVYFVNMDKAYCDLVAGFVVAIKNSVA